MSYSCNINVYLQISELQLLEATMSRSFQLDSLRAPGSEGVAHFSFPREFSPPFALCLSAWSVCDVICLSRTWSWSHSSLLSVFWRAVLNFLFFLFLCCPFLSRSFSTLKSSPWLACAFLLALSLSLSELSLLLSRSCALSLSLSVSLSFLLALSPSLSLFLSFSPSFSQRLSVCLSVCLPVCLSVCLSVCLRLALSRSVSLYLSETVAL